VGFVVDKVALGQVFSECFGFPHQFSFHRLLHIQHLSTGASQLVADVPNELSLTPPQETKKKNSYDTRLQDADLTLALILKIFAHCNKK
jgi:hypothetical protein